jgi:hypothetical protein
MNPIPKIPKNPSIFTCVNCHYNTSSKKDYKKHEQTIKHRSTLNPNETYIKNPVVFYLCKCGKKYKHSSTLSTHKKKCLVKAEIVQNPSEDIIDILIHENKDFKNIILELVKNNGDLQKQMMEVCKKSSINNNTVNSHNKTFNMQFFLNEQCKDAMNIMDFVDSMTLEFADLEDVGKLGYVEGISNIIIRKLNEMDIYKRPIHCSDVKREIMFVKDDNVWEKENSTYDRIRKAIKHITKKNGDMMIPWSQKHPSCMNIEHRLNEVYVQIMGQCMGGKESFVESENKIMKKIAKAVFIDKAC